MRAPLLIALLTCCLVLSAGSAYAGGDLPPGPSDKEYCATHPDNSTCSGWCSQFPDANYSWCPKKEPEKKKRMTVKQYKAMVEARAATAFIVNQGGDLVNKAMQNLGSFFNSNKNENQQTTGGANQNGPQKELGHWQQTIGSDGSPQLKWVSTSGPLSNLPDPSETGQQQRQGNPTHFYKDAFKFAPFGAVSGSTQRIESGSYVDVSGLGVVLGLGARKEFDAVAFTAGLFFEYGTSRFNTHNGFDEGDVDGKGHATAVGGGVLARLDFTEKLLKGLYFEGAFRMGGIRSDWSSDDLRSETGRHASYDLYSPYHGAILGLGYIWEVTDSFKLDFYGQWLWSHVYGGDAYIVDVPFEFDDVDSHRLRAGVRADWNITEQLGIYAGAAWEHEFDGRARATADGVDTPSPSIKGDTGVFDLGFAFKPAALPGLSLQLGATASAGKRHGVGGNFMVKYEF